MKKIEIISRKNVKFTVNLNEKLTKKDFCYKVLEEPNGAIHS